MSSSSRDEPESSSPTLSGPELDGSVYRVIFDTALDAVFVAGDDRRYVAVNQAACDLLGLDRASILGHRIEEFFKTGAGSVEESWQRFLKSGEQTGEIHFRRPGGGFREVEYRGKANFVPGLHLSVMRDVSELKRVEAQLSESQQKLGGLFNQMAVGVFQLDLAGRMVFVNQKFCDLAGHTAKDLRDRRMQEIIHSEDVPALLEGFEQAVEGGGQGFTVESRLVHPSGAAVWVTISLSLLRDSDGIPRLAIAIVQDVTERRLAQEALRYSVERFRAMFEQSPISTQILAPSGYTLEVNQAWQRMWAATGEELADYNILRDSQLVDSGVMPAVRRAFEGEPSEVPETLYRADRGGFRGRPMWIKAFLYPVKDASGAVREVVLMHEDVTHRKRAEEALREANRTLEKTNDDLMHFAYVASHDLQEPLRTVNSYTQLIFRRYGDRLDSAGQEFLNYVLDAAHRMAELTEDLRQYAYAVDIRQQPELTGVNLEEVLQAAERNLAEAIRDCHAQVTHDRLPAVRGNFAQLVQVLQNLLGNAIKYHGEQAPRVHIAAAKQNQDWVICVTDNGIGIDPRYAGRIFLPFKRLHGKDYPGTGVGLAICRKVVERHGGRIWVESQPGRGSKFCFTLPEAPREA